MSVNLGEARHSILTEVLPSLTHGIGTYGEVGEMQFSVGKRDGRNDAVPAEPNPIEKRHAFIRNIDPGKFI
jgi:hypothetical protein